MSCRRRTLKTVDIEDPKTRDAGCGYFNAAWPIIVPHCFVFVGAVFSIAALGDCSFAETKEYPILDGFVTRRIGFLTFEQSDGKCYWYDQFTDTISAYDQIQQYWDILGLTWRKAAFYAAVAVVFSVGFLFYTTSFCCSSQVREIRYRHGFLLSIFLPARYVNGFLLSLFLLIMQGSTFIVFGSSFCDENGCTFGRSAWFSVVAIVWYLDAGIAFLVTRDYPGDSLSTAVSYASEAHPPTKTVPQGTADGTLSKIEGRRTVPSDPEVIAQRC